MAQSHSANKTVGDASPAQTSATREMKFEDALAELEQIVRTMEEGHLPLEESIASYRRGSELLKHCQQQISDAERKIQVLEDGALRDFDVTGGESK